MKLRALILDVDGTLADTEEAHLCAFNEAFQQPGLDNGLAAAKAAGQYIIVTPSYWTRTEDFSSADLVLPSLGSADNPLPSCTASLIGSGMLGIREIDRQLNAIRECE
jgi:hypothetical protein